AKPSQPAGAATVSRTIRSPGGTLAVSCSGDVANLVYATPAAGWHMRPDQTSRNSVRVVFVQDTTRYQVTGRCHHGTVEAEVDQETASEGD
ncbi:MAG: hypothetical protein WCB04_14495, partial [Mycobacteriales bacterium]